MPVTNHDETKAVMLIVLLWAPAIAVPVIVQALRCDACWAEPIAAFVCQLLLMPFVVIPVLVLCFFLIGGYVPRRVAELCVVWVLWNSHLIGIGFMLLPFLLASFHTEDTYAEVLYDFFIFFAFVPMPMIFLSGGLKLVSNQNGWRWGWPQRAALGSYCILVTLCMWAGQASGGRRRWGWPLALAQSILSD